MTMKQSFTALGAGLALALAKGAQAQCLRDGEV